ncbi:MAG TPA: C40 family peptidase, partial [Chthonomonadaceae bacterium]|nr:C40 family peptidase [Chthonomonadaceae bacterium]
APAGTYVAIQQESGTWVGVLMADGSTGWLRSENVRMLDYQVVSNGSAMMPSGGGDIYPSSSIPLLTTDPQAILNEAYRYMGVRYVWGGNGYSGIDCSGFVKNVFAANGYRLPRTATEQMAYGVPVPVDQLQAGDRLYFGHKKNAFGVTHTGIYIGNGYFIHSSSSRKGVAISRLDEPMYARIFVCARR